MIKEITIAIPTYNRKPNLIERLHELSREKLHSYENISVCIFDNGSEDPIRKEDLPYSIAEKVKIKHRGFNVGICQNIIRCCEDSETDYVVILGDDDPIKPGYLDIIEASIKKISNDTFGICFRTALAKRDSMNDQRIKSVSELLDSLNSFGNFLFISNWLINRELYLKYIFHAHVQSSGGFGVIAPHLMALNDGCDLILSSEELVEYKPTDLEKKWSWFKFLLNASLIFDLPLNLNRADFKRLKLKFMNLGNRNCSYLYGCLLAENQGKISYHDRHLFRKICYSTGYLIPRQRVPLSLLRLALVFKPLRPFVGYLNRLTRSVRANASYQTNRSSDSSL